ncbi:MAG: hypothetical protein VKL59_26360 [Nostocaceae cyanobacterium]|nr:hypothetical protein [Nostocaceae cyanobacterium]
MSYVNRPMDDQVMTEPTMVGRVVDYHDRVRWGPIISGLMIAITAQLILSAIFAALGANTIANLAAPRNQAADVVGNVGIWSTIALLISLFIGAWVAGRACGPMNRSTALLNGAILWATAVAISSWLLASGVSGAFGIAAMRIAETLPQTQLPSDTVQNLSAAASRSLWWFVFGSLLGLVASLAGSATGVRRPHGNQERR